MATNFTRPTLAEIIDRVSTDIESNLTGVTARLRRTAEYAIALAQAGVSHTLHGHIAWAVEQILPDTAAETYVRRWGSLLGVEDKTPQRSTGNVTATGTGGTLTAGTHQFVRVADGRLYDIDATVTGITTGSAVAVTAVEAGEDGDVLEGQTLVVTPTPTNVSSTGTVASGGITGGTDPEPLDEYTERVVDRMQHPPMGGAPGDHVTWALAMPTLAVTRAWEYAGRDGVGNLAIGKMAVTFVLDDEDGTVNLPDSDQVDAMQAYMDETSPMEVIVFAPTSLPYDYSVTLTPNADETVQDAVEAEVLDMIQREAEPGGTIPLSKLDEAISAAAGETSHVTNSSSSSVTPTFGQIFIYGAATFP